jgi:hypothetical protein
LINYLKEKGQKDNKVKINSLEEKEEYILDDETNT